MDRLDFTKQIMEDMGWVAYNDSDLNIDDVIYNIKAKNEDGSYVWEYLRCRDDKMDYVKYEIDSGLTYKITYKKEYFEVSEDCKIWYTVAVRDTEISRKCVSD